MSRAPSIVTDRSGGRRIVRVADVPLSTIEAALVAEPVERLKTNERRAVLARVPFDVHGDAVLKERRTSTLAARLEDAFRGTRARRAFDAAVGLLERGVPVAAPLACVEESERSVYLARFVPGETLDRAIERAPDRTALVARAAGLAARLHRAGATHGDLKPRNIVVGDELVLIDLERVRLGREAVVRRVVRDLAALDAYGQRLSQRLGVRERWRAFETYVEARGTGRELLARVIAESRAKRARWRAAGIA